MYCMTPLTQNLVLIQVEHHTSATACESSACDTDNYGRGVGQ